MKYLIFSISVWCSFLTVAQINTSEKRIEIDLKDGYFHEKVHELDSAGFLITSTEGKPNKASNKIRFQYYSINLELLDEQIFEIPKGYISLAEHKKGTLFSQLYCAVSGNFIILQYDVKNRKLVQTFGKSEKKLRAVFWVNPKPYFEANSEKAYFILNVKRNKYLFTFHLKTAKLQQTLIKINGVKTKKLRVQHATLDTAMLYVPITHVKPRKKPTTYLIEFDVNGTLLTITPMDKNVKRPFFNTSISALPKKDIIMTGVTGRDARFGSSGMYIKTTIDETVQNTQYYNYTDIPNFTDFKPGKTLRRVSLIQWIFSKFGHDVTYYYQMTAPQIIPCGEHYIFISEFYVPTYTMAPTVRVQKGKRKTTIKRVFNGFQYTHALVTKITNKGEMIWSQCIELYPETKPYYPKQFLNILEQNEAYVHLFYADVETIYELKIDYNGEILSDQEVGKIGGLLSDDQVKLSYADLDYWYDQNFISYGAQRIKNTKDKSVKRRRTVIYINKVGMTKTPE
ncbi:MAG: hypothetical protein RLZZ531_259 [Bacteroidota bacterium]